MPDAKISDLTDGAPLQASDIVVIARSGQNYKLTGTELGAGFQPVDSDLTAIAALDSSTSGAIASDGAGWIKKTYAQFKTALALAKADVGLGSVDNTADAAKSVASAAVLTTARTIDGISFNGSANITMLAEATHAATSKTTPVDADELPLVDSAASNVLKKLTWANLKATLPGNEIKYAPITSTVNIVSTTEATGTTIISPGAVTFDGAAVLVHFSGIVTLPQAASTTNFVVINLFESSTQITRLATAQINDANVGTTIPATFSVAGWYRFTPTAGSHTYTITAYVNSTTGTPAVIAGSGGTNGYAPAFVRFTKV